MKWYWILALVLGAFIIGIIIYKMINKGESTNGNGNGGEGVPVGITIKEGNGGGGAAHVVGNLIPVGGNELVLQIS